MEIFCYLFIELILVDIGWYVYEGLILFLGIWVGSLDLLLGCRIKNRGRWLGKFYILKYYFEFFEIYLFNRVFIINCLIFNIFKLLLIINLYLILCWSVFKSVLFLFGRFCIRK